MSVSDNFCLLVTRTLGGKQTRLSGQNEKPKNPYVRCLLGKADPKETVSLKTWSLQKMFWESISVY